MRLSWPWWKITNLIYWMKILKVSISLSEINIFNKISKLNINMYIKNLETLLNIDKIFYSSITRNIFIMYPHQLWRSSKHHGEKKGASLKDRSGFFSLCDIFKMIQIKLVIFSKLSEARTDAYITVCLM